MLAQISTKITDASLIVRFPTLPSDPRIPFSAIQRRNGIVSHDEFSGPGRT
jgi:hypothetical protein